MTGKEYISRIHDLPCVVCEVMGVTQSTETEAHHVESVRDANSDFAACALCVDHHRGANGVHGLGRRGFTVRYRLSDVDLLALTVKALAREMA